MIEAKEPKAQDIVTYGSGYALCSGKTREGKIVLHPITSLNLALAITKSSWKVPENATTNQVFSDSRSDKHKIAKTEGQKITVVKVSGVPVQYDPCKHFVVTQIPLLLPREFKIT